MSPTSGFHSEWITVEGQRVLLECRASFPGEYMRFMARVAAFTVGANARNAAVVRIFHDDKACCHLVDVASTDAEDEGVCDRVTEVLQMMHDDGSRYSQFQLVEEGKRDSDHYHHIEHLSVSSGVAVDRWRHLDDEYLKSIGNPR